jgi:hypothetical protein
MFYPKKNTSTHKGAAMKRYRKQMPSDQVYIPETSGLKTKCVTLLVYEEQGRQSFNLWQQNKKPVNFKNYSKTAPSRSGYPTARTMLIISTFPY